MVKPRRGRRAAHSGLWYTDDPKQLRAELDNLIGRAAAANKALDVPRNDGVLSCGERPKAVICPHAGYRYCGRTAAYGWNALFPFLKDIERFVILGPSHHIGFSGCCLPDPDIAYYETPLGPLRLDTTEIEKLRASNEFGTLSRDDDEAEHSIEMQLPFLRFILDKSESTTPAGGIVEHPITSSDSPSFCGDRMRPKLLPILVGDLSAESTRHYARLLQPYFDDTATIFVISSDFCHWGKRFGYTYLPPETNIEEVTSDATTSDCSYLEGALRANAISRKIERLDRQGIQLITQHDAQGFATYLKTTRNTICGAKPIKILLTLLQCSSSTAFSTSDLHYSQSSPIHNTAADTSVSYASLCTRHVK